jgi:hypothetical protein
MGARHCEERSDEAIQAPPKAPPSPPEGGDVRQHPVGTQAPPCPNYPAGFTCVEP